ncbi:Pleiotropic drug resistance protein 3, partial [Mucuna pruriens]
MKLLSASQVPPGQSSPFQSAESIPANRVPPIRFSKECSTKYNPKKGTLCTLYNPNSRGRCENWCPPWGVEKTIPYDHYTKSKEATVFEGRKVATIGIYSNRPPNCLVTRRSTLGQRESISNATDSTPLPEDLRHHHCHRLLGCKKDGHSFIFSRSGNTRSAKTRASPSKRAKGESLTRNRFGGNRSGTEEEVNVNVERGTCFHCQISGFTEKRLRLLSDITSFIQTWHTNNIDGSQWSKKTTFTDILYGRKTGGIIEGEIRIGGYLKVQETFARV